MELEKGQQVLVQNLEELIEEAKAGEFGDFSNEKYTTPKIELRNKLLALAQAVVEGRYD